ncbi:chemotaxis response regulator protein-glutamate methylesterase [Leptospira bandrabouensis]|uniref:protein-glutamate methylesterase/protein-glutamine glutaminase n=1 Tax=Leptospira bandrabouensis TaxID=2484903 RepID=UPI00223D086D|nr:chemotaxis response regulator protein-glutamate methylesterase [Leptospira bandrabouensis]MCW7458626.1 chemotaxis response regulator protein-glutamate methylesterase [Leptospira bandrabouensis]MCW7478552.1 chemotaxis response regulator protein-glutamate methylesterase [Leptospira bandrabouensis]MCW7486163.1 chemotaxis response regulator protein-glutamate methylesterase [Leptospira bandrabouensis]
MNKKPTVVIIDDSLLVRNILSDALTKKDEVQVIATGKTGMDCIDLAGKLKPDFIVLDIEMPIMDGLTALAEIKKLKLPSHVIMLSVLTQHGADATFKALELGAVDFIPKPSSGNQFSPEDIAAVLSAKIKGFSDSRQPSIEVQLRPERTERQLNKSFQKPIKVEAIGIGTSTGGPKALQTVFASIPEDFTKPIFVVQHMPAGFTKAFADRLNSLSKIQVKEAEDGDLVHPGTAYIAPGDYQMKVITKGRDHVIELNHTGQVNGHRPSIEVLFDSLVEAYGGDHLLSIIMTGMGKDGSQAITNIHAKGGITLAQNEATSVVYGMNRVAVELGGIDFVLPVEELVPKMIELLKSRGN